VIDLDRVDPAGLPAQIAISAVTLAELAAGPHATDDLAERSRRQDRLQRSETLFEAIPFGAASARAYARTYAQARAGGRSRRTRAIDLLIAATALAEDLPLYTSNPADFSDLEGLVTVIPVSARSG
jgi:predicted nucleic acid-binding protein